MLCMGYTSKAKSGQVKMKRCQGTGKERRKAGVIISASNEVEFRPKKY